MPGLTALPKVLRCQVWQHCLQSTALPGLSTAYRVLRCQVWQHCLQCTVMPGLTALLTVYCDARSDSTAYSVLWCQAWQHCLQWCTAMLGQCTATQSDSTTTTVHSPPLSLDKSIIPVSDTQQNVTQMYQHKKMFPSSGAFQNCNSVFKSWTSNSNKELQTLPASSFLESWNGNEELQTFPVCSSQRSQWIHGALSMYYMKQNHHHHANTRGCPKISQLCAWCWWSKQLCRQSSRQMGGSSSVVHCRVGDLRSDGGFTLSLWAQFEAVVGHVSFASIWNNITFASGQGVNILVVNHQGRRLPVEQRVTIRRQHSQLLLWSTSNRKRINECSVMLLWFVVCAWVQVGMWVCISACWSMCVVVCVGEVCVTTMFLMFESHAKKKA